LRESLTYDEPVHIQEGKNAILHHTFSIDTNNPPFVREFEVVPLLFHADSLIHSPLPLMKVLPARLMTLLFAVGLALAVFITTSVYIGATEAFIALLLFIFDPNILANDHYVTLDMGFTLLFFLSYIFLLNILNRPNQQSSPHPHGAIWRLFHSTEVRSYALLAVTTGLGLASKISFLPYFVVSAFILLIVKKRRGSFTFLWQEKYRVLFMCFFSLVVLWATYFFKTDVIIAQRADTGRVSYRLEQFAKTHHIGFVSELLKFGEQQSVPLGNYLAMIKNNTIRNTKGGSFFFLGKIYPKHKWYFLPVGVLLQTPIPLIILFLISVFSVFARSLLRKDKSSGLLYKFSSWFTESSSGKNDNTISFLIPVLAILFIGSSTNMVPLVRYVLPIYPFVVIIAAQGVVFLAQKQSGKILAGVLLLWYLLSMLSYFPHFISYSNELLGVSRQKDLLFFDSNMDWGEGLPDVKQYVDQKKPKTMYFSYFSTDDPSLYGLKSTTQFKSNRLKYLCEFHTVPIAKRGEDITAISLSGWYDCEYYQKPQFEKGKIKDIVGHSILIF